MALNRNKLICIKTLLTKLNIKDGDAMVMGYSDMRTGHVSELTEAEANIMIRELKKLDPDEAIADNMRKKMIGMCYEYHGLGKQATDTQKREAVKHLERWVLKYGHGGNNGRHKSFNAYTKDELPTLVTQFQTVYKEHLKKV